MRWFFVEINLWWLSIGSDDVCVLQLIYEHGGGPEPQPRGTESWTVGSLEVSFLWSLPRLLCGVSLWQQWVFGIEPLQSWQQLCEPSLTQILDSSHISHRYMGLNFYFLYIYIYIYIYKIEVRNEKNPPNTNFINIFFIFLHLHSHTHTHTHTHIYI